MGISIDLWRARIGLFHGSLKVLSLNGPCKSAKAYFAYGVIVCVLLLIGCVESHPGPAASQKNEIAEIKEILCSVKESNDSLVAEVKKKIGITISQLVGRLNAVETELQYVSGDVIKLQEHTKYLEDKIDDLENRSRRQNIVVHGIEEDDHENWEQTEEKLISMIRDRLQIEIPPEQIERAHRTGFKHPAKPRPIVCKFISDKTKQRVLKNRKRLRGSKIYIDDDYSKKVREERMQLKEYMFEARSKGSFAYLRFKYLYIDNQKFTLSDLENMNNDQRSNTEDKGMASSDTFPSGSVQGIPTSHNSQVKVSSKTKMRSLPPSTIVFDHSLFPLPK